MYISETKRRFALLASCLAAAAVPVNAAIIPLDGSGWQAEVDDSLFNAGLVGLHVDAVTKDAVFIEKSAEFREGPVEGVFPSIEIIFTRTDVAAVSNIVIDDEIIRNETGVDWTDFHMEVIGGNARFDPVATASSGGPGPIGFNISPFSEAAFSAYDTCLDIWDGVVADGTTWYPGSGALDGQLWIEIGPGGQPSFRLIETPTPEPAVFALLATAGLLGVFRRR